MPYLTQSLTVNLLPDEIIANLDATTCRAEYELQINHDPLFVFLPAICPLPLPVREWQ